MAENGNNNKIYIVTGGSTYTVIGGELSNNFTVNAEIVNVSSKDNDWAANIAGEKSFEASGSFNLDKSSVIHNSLRAGDTVTIFIGQIVGSTPRYGVSGSAIIASTAVASERNSAVTIDISFTGTGTLTYINSSITTVAPTTTV